MNVAIEKIEISVVDQPERAQPHDSVMRSQDIPVELAEEIFLQENPERRLYRRSVAYFFFGFGSKKNSIVTDEP